LKSAESSYQNSEHSVGALSERPQITI